MREESGGWNHLKRERMWAIKEYLRKQLDELAGLYFIAT